MTEFPSRPKPFTMEEYLTEYENNIGFRFKTTLPNSFHVKMTLYKLSIEISKTF